MYNSKTSTKLRRVEVYRLPTNSLIDFLLCA